MTSTLTLLHALATLNLMGLIWFVQIVHYPLFATVGESSFVKYHEGHTSRTSLVVLPMMLVEAGTAVVLAAAPPPGVPAAVPWAGLAILAGIWASTFLLQVPDHNRLGSGLDHRVQRRLTRWNWLRTAGWSVRGVLALTMI